VRWSAKLGRFAGIDVYVHVTFLLLLAWFGYAAWQQTGSVAGVVNALTLIVLLFLCVLLHEYGHALTARRFGIGTLHITLLPIGGVALLESMPKDPRQEVLVALAGPAVNLVIAGVVYVLLGLTSRPDAVFGIHPARTGLLQGLLSANLLLALFNMLPAFPMDGGRVLRALLAMRMDRVRATRTAARIGQALAVGLGFLGVTGNPFLVLIAVFVWIGAGAEAEAVEVEERLDRRTAGRAMMTTIETMAPTDPLSRAIDLTLSGAQKHFPVLDGPRIAGVLTQAAILRGLRDGGPEAPVSGYLQPAQTADVGTPRGTLLDNLQGADAHLVCMTRGGALAGIVDLDNINEFLRIQAALAGRRHA
jgi:Zn-dependent protease/CBS domain-containing protein